MAVLALLALLLGAFCGHFWQENAIVDAFLASDGLFLNLLMVSVGIGIGQQSGIWQKNPAVSRKSPRYPLGRHPGLPRGRPGRLLDHRLSPGRGHGHRQLHGLVQPGRRYHRRLIRGSVWQRGFFEQPVARASFLF